MRLEKGQRSMAVMMWVMSLTLLMQGCLCSRGHTDKGCMKWTKNGEDVCCDVCFPGNHLVKACGRSPKDLCTPCEPGTYSVNPLKFKCDTCTQCLGAQVLVKECTPTTDTKCGCEEGLICGDSACSFCVKKCDKGYEPTEDRSCRPCPEGTFNDKTQQMCKPWKTKCPHPGEYIMSKGDATTDIKCANSTVSLVHNKGQHAATGQVWPSLVVFVLVSLVLISSSIIIFFVVVKRLQKGQKTNKAPTNTPIIRTPTDDPRTLIAIECSFHEAQQEQGSSSESVDSKDSSRQLIA